jgi:hypothetical protein
MHMPNRRRKVKQPLAQMHLEAGKYVRAACDSYALKILNDIQRGMQQTDH